MAAGDGATHLLGVCTPAWTPAFGGAGSPASGAFSLQVLDDTTGGSGALVVGGFFTSVGGVPANRVATWNGAAWSALGSGTGFGAVLAMATFNDGSGSALYVGGTFFTAGGSPANCIAKWNGSAWTPLGAGLDNEVDALAVFDDGGGPALYAAGAFTTAGGIPANRVAKWNGSAWSALGSGTNSFVRALAVFNDGTGSALYAAGIFSTAGGVPAHRIAKWNGSAWSPLGLGITGGDVQALAVVNDGTGPALYAGGTFTSAGGASANGIAKWNGTSWQALGPGLSGGSVNTMCGFDDGYGPKVYVGGSFTSSGGQSINRVAVWNGASWAQVGAGLGAEVRAFAVFNDGLCRGADLWVAGAFATSPANDKYVARWAGCPIGGSGIIGDFDGDGGVNGADLGILLSQWGACAGCSADLNCDGTVSGADLGDLLSRWQP